MSNNKNNACLRIYLNNFPVTIKNLFYDWFQGHCFQIQYWLESEREREWEREKRACEKRAGSSISRLSGDPATGKSFRCVQNKNPGTEGLFHAEWGMEGSYHPQGRSWLLTHDPALKEGNAGEEGGTSPSTAFVKPRRRHGKSKRDLTKHLTSELFYLYAIHSLYKRLESQISSPLLHVHLTKLMSTLSSIQTHTCILRFCCFVAAPCLFILIKESEWPLTFSDLSHQHVSSRCADVTQAQWACNFSTDQ